MQTKQIRKGKENTEGERKAGGAKSDTVGEVCVVQSSDRAVGEGYREIQKQEMQLVHRQAHSLQAESRIYVTEF